MIDELDAVDPRLSVTNLVSALEANVDRLSRRELTLYSRRFASGGIFADAAVRAIAANPAIVFTVAPVLFVSVSFEVCFRVENMDLYRQV